MFTNLILMQAHNVYDTISLYAQFKENSYSKWAGGGVFKARVWVLCGSKMNQGILPVER